MKNSKKIISIVLALLMILSLTSVAFANEEEVVIQKQSGESCNIDMLSEVETFAKSGEIPTASYNAKVVKTPNEEYKVYFDFTINMNGNEYNSATEGLVDEEILSDGTVYLSGPLEGSIAFEGGEKFDIIVGFQTALGENDIAAGVNLMSNNGSIFFSFGKYIMPDEIYERYNTQPVTVNIPETTEEKATTPMATATTDFEDMGSCYGSCDEVNTYVNALTVYYKDTGDVLAATIESNAKALLTDSFFSTSRVYRVSATFESNNPSCYINRFFYAPGEPTPDGTSIRSIIGEFIYDVFSHIVENYTGIRAPSQAILNTIEQALGGTIKASKNITETIATYSSTMTSGDLDSAELPVAVELDTKISDRYNFTVSSDIRYVCTYIKQIYYVNAETASIDVDVDVEH